MSKAHYEKYYSSRVNPYLKSNIGAKIPDGKANLSNAIRVQAVKSVDCKGRLPAAGSTYDGDCVICMIPSVTNGACILKGTTSTTAFSDYEVLQFDKHVAIKGSGAPNVVLTQDPSNRIMKWRLVSQALKISLINNAEENDGWWEAIRIQPDIRDNSYNLLVSPVNLLAVVGTGTDVTINGASKRLPFMVDTFGTWSQHPSYVSGRLREIHHVMFRLNSTSTDHDFIDIRDGIDKSALLDGSFDCVYIRIHGRTTTVNDASNSKILLHCVSNQELVYSDDAILNQYATPSALYTNAIQRAESVDRLSPASAA